MSNLISRQAAIDGLGEEPPVWYDGEDEIAERNQWRRDVTAIKELPSAQPERKKGRWIPHEDEDGEHYGDKCSECGVWYVMPYGKTNFCPNCGADMRGEK